jgi:hypothetical protein
MADSDASPDDEGPVLHATHRLVLLSMIVMMTFSCCTPSFLDVSSLLSLLLHPPSLLQMLVVMADAISNIFNVDMFLHLFCHRFSAPMLNYTEGFIQRMEKQGISKHFTAIPPLLYVRIAVCFAIKPMSQHFCHVQLLLLHSQKAFCFIPQPVHPSVPQATRRDALCTQ